MLPLGAQGAPAIQASPAPAGISLEDLPPADLSRLRQAFNDATGNVRMLLILSPSCPGCQKGSRDMQAQVLGKIDFEKLKVFVVWFPLFAKSDSREVALQTGAIYTDPRVVQFWQPDWTLGNLYGKVLPFPKSYQYKVAVDVYLIFDEQQTWGEEVPQPRAFMHRLGEDERLFDPAVLRSLVEGQIRETVARGACNCNAPKRDAGSTPPSPGGASGR
jgi:hypothetical protein